MISGCGEADPTDISSGRNRVDDNHTITALFWTKVILLLREVHYGSIAAIGKFHDFVHSHLILLVRCGRWFNGFLLLLDQKPGLLGWAGPCLLALLLDRLRSIAFTLLFCHAHNKLR
jgi:hypothetical protein